MKDYNMKGGLGPVWLLYLTGILNNSHSGGIQSNIQGVNDVNHKLPHGLKLMWSNAAGAVDEED